MFNLSGSEIVVILLLALIVLGPDKLPEAMRKAGRTWAEIRKISSGFQEEVRKGFDEPAKEARETAAAVKKAASFANAPVKGAQKAAKGAVKSLLDPPKTGVVDTTATEVAESDEDAAPTDAAEGADEAVDEAADAATVSPSTVDVDPDAGDDTETDKADATP